jgi:hypothetical protein
MTIRSFTVTRNVDAKDSNGQPCKIALASIIHENGVGQTVAIREDLIAFAGEQIIEAEVMRAASSPGRASLKPPKPTN